MVDGGIVNGSTATKVPRPRIARRIFNLYEIVDGLLVLRIEYVAPFRGIAWVDCATSSNGVPNNFGSPVEPDVKYAEPTVCELTRSRTGRVDEGSQFN